MSRFALPLAHPKQECLVDVPRTHRGEGSSSSLDLTPAAAKTENKKGHSVSPVHPPAPRRLVGNLRSPLRSDSDGGQRERERGEIEMSAKKPLRWRQKHRLCQRQRGYRHPSAAVRERRGERSSRTRNTNPIRNLLRLPTGYKSGRRHRWRGIIKIQTEARAVFGGRGGCVSFGLMQVWNSIGHFDHSGVRTR